MNFKLLRLKLRRKTINRHKFKKEVDETLEFTLFRKKLLRAESEIMPALYGHEIHIKFKNFNPENDNFEEKRKEVIDLLDNRFNCNQFLFTDLIDEYTGEKIGLSYETRKGYELHTSCLMLYDMALGLDIKDRYFDEQVLMHALGSSKFMKKNLEHCKTEEKQLELKILEQYIKMQVLLNEQEIKENKLLKNLLDKLEVSYDSTIESKDLKELVCNNSSVTDLNKLCNDLQSDVDIYVKESKARKYTITELENELNRANKELEESKIQLQEYEELKSHNQALKDKLDNLIDENRRMSEINEQLKIQDKSEDNEEISDFNLEEYFSKNLSSWNELNDNSKELLLEFDINKELKYINIIDTLIKEAGINNLPGASKKSNASTIEEIIQLLEKSDGNFNSDFEWKNTQTTKEKRDILKSYLESSENEES